MEKTIINFTNFMQDCINNQERVMVSAMCRDSHITDSFVPEDSKVEKNYIHIEGNWLEVNIEGEYNISYDKMNELYIIKQGEVNYLIGN